MSTSSNQLVGLLRRKYSASTPIVGAEIGIHDGRTSALLLKKFEQLHLVMVDWWETEGYYRTERSEHLLAAKNATAFAKERRTIMISDSGSAARWVPNESLDFVYIDGDHTYQGVHNDLFHWTPKVKFNGLVLGHDYPWEKHIGRVGARNIGVKQAVDEFVVMMGYKLEVFSRKTYLFQRTKSC